MSLIRACVIVGVAIYCTLACIEYTDHMFVLPESAGIIILLVGLGFLIHYNRTEETEEKTERTETIILTGCIMLFALYAVLRTGGII